MSCIMIEDTLLNYIVLYTLLELYEVQWQKSDTILGMLKRMYGEYDKSAFLFLLMHPTLYFGIMFVMVSGYNEYAILLLGVKSIDIVTKMLLLKKIFIEKQVDEELQLILVTPLHKLFPYIGLLLYPPLIYMAFSVGG